MTVKPRYLSYLELMRMDKPVGSLLLMWPTFWALMLASQGLPEFSLCVIFALGVFLMRSAGCVANDIADRNFDGFVSRTQNRPLATKSISVKEAVCLLLVLLSLSACLLLPLSYFTQQMALPALVLALSYPLMKRITYWPQLFLGAAFNWGILMAYAEVQMKIPVEAWMLYILGVLWTLTYDTMYAMADREDDLKIGIKSTAILFAEMDVVILLSLHVMLILGFILLGLKAKLSWVFFLGVGCASLNAFAQIRLIQYRVPEDCLKAFKLNNIYGLFILLGFVFG